MAESQITSNVLLRVKRIQVGAASGTIFTIEVDKRQYLITAKHVVAALKDKDKAALCEGKKCAEIPVTVLRCADPIDIAVLVPELQQTISFPLEPELKGAVFGQDMFFLGYPYADNSLVTNVGEQTVAFIRKATFSAQQRSDEATVLYLDGRNNPGFSGGPIIFRDINQAGLVLKVAGVVSGFRHELGDVYKPEPIEAAQIKPEDWALGHIVRGANGQYSRLNPTGDVVKVNTDIVVGYAIDHAVELIRKNKAQGPLVKE